MLHVLTCGFCDSELVNRETNCNGHQQLHFPTYYSSRSEPSWWNKANRWNRNMTGFLMHKKVLHDLPVSDSSTLSYELAERTFVGHQHQHLSSRVRSSRQKGWSVLRKKVAFTHFNQRCTVAYPWSAYLLISTTINLI